MKFRIDAFPQLFNGESVIHVKKEYLKRFWSFGDVDKIPFLPLVCSFASRIEAVSIETLLTNPTKMANSLQKTQQLCGYDGIFIIPDSTLEAEACGCQLGWDINGEMPHLVSHCLKEGKAVDQLYVSGIENKGRIPVVLEATKRLQMVMGNKLDIIGTVTGPLTLSEHLGGEKLIHNLKGDFNEVSDIISYANKVIIHLCRLYCERQVDGILVCDTLISEMNYETLKLIRPFYRTLYNVTSYYNMYLLISVGSLPVETIETVFDLEANGFIISGMTEVDNVLQLAGSKRKHVGVGIPKTALLGSMDFLKDTVRNLIPKRKRGFFFTTEGEVPYTTPVENMHELMDILYR